MKILIVNKFLYPKGGSETYSLKIGEELSRLGHEVEYFGMEDERNVVGNSLGEYTANMDFHGSSLSRLTYPFKIIYSFEAKRKIGMVLDGFKPDIVHLNIINFQLTPSTIDAIAKRNIPIIQTVHDYQFICPNHLMYNGSVCERCLNGSKLNCIKRRCIHGSLVKSVLGSVEAWFYKLKGTYKKVDLYVCPSRFLESKLLEGSPVFKGKTRVIHNFVKKKLSSEKGSPYPFRYFAFAGRLSEEKGVRVLAETAKLLPDVRFIVMGDGAEGNLFDGLDNVILAGFVTGEEFDNIMKNAEAVLVPSVCYENCPLSILEAKALGVPAVAVNMGGMAELVEEGITGVLAEKPTGEAFAKAVKKLARDAKRVAEMKRNCLEKSSEVADLKEYTEDIVKIYKEFIG